MMFSFWTQPVGKEAPPPLGGINEWRSIFPGFRLFGDADVIDILGGMSHEYVDMYKRIKLPACRSDLARLVLAHHYGGLYVDIHTHPVNMGALAHSFSLLSEYEMVLCDRIGKWKDEDDMSIVNGAIWCRKNAEILSIIIRRVLDNLLEHMKKEGGTDCYVPYNLTVLSGTWAIIESVFDLSQPRPLPFRKEAEGKVCRYLHPNNRKTTPFQFYRHYDDREPGQHWSELQQTQRLFSERILST